MFGVGDKSLGTHHDLFTAPTIGQPQKLIYDLAKTTQYGKQRP